MIFLFTKQDCPKCRQIKKALKGYLARCRDTCIEKDVETDEGLTEYHFYNRGNAMRLPLAVEVGTHEEYVRDVTAEIEKIEKGRKG